MMKTIIGDLFQTDIQNLAHGCNAQGVMGSGVAYIIQKEFPLAYKEYVRDIKAGKLLLGGWQMVPCNGKNIFNLITQDNYGMGTRMCSYDAIDSCFQQLNREFKGQQFAIPMIGAGLGGGSWSVIKEIIEEASKDINVVVYKLEE